MKRPPWFVGIAGKMDLNLERAKLRLWQALKYLKGCPGDPCGRIPEVLTLESQKSWMEALRNVV